MAIFKKYHSLIFRLATGLTPAEEDMANPPAQSKLSAHWRSKNGSWNMLTQNDLEEPLYEAPTYDNVEDAHALEGEALETARGIIRVHLS